MWLAATPVSLRASTPYKKNRNFVAPASPQVRPLITMRQPVLLATSPASRLRNHTHRKVGRPTPQGLRCIRRTKRQGWTLCLCRSRRLRPPSPYGIRRKDATGCWVWARWSAVLRASDARPYKAATQDSHGGCKPPFSMDRAPRRKAGRPYSIVQLGCAPRYTTRVSALVAREKDTLLSR